ncbi:unnamed protein product [Auanema sp. JU1783]|nr:unnamed protein product [Auanema sp. JU1783]
MSERKTSVCSASCGCSIEASALLAALPEKLRDLRTSSVALVYGLEHIKFNVHKELGHICWLFSKLDKNSLLAINNGPFDAYSFIEHMKNLSSLCSKLARVSEVHDIRAALQVWKLPVDSAELRSFVKKFTDQLQEDISDELIRPRKTH